MAICQYCGGLHFSHSCQHRGLGNNFVNRKPGGAYKEGYLYRRDNPSHSNTYNPRCRNESNSCKESASLSKLEILMWKHCEKQAKVLEKSSPTITPNAEELYAQMINDSSPPVYFDDLPRFGEYHSDVEESDSESSRWDYDEEFGISFLFEEVVIEQELDEPFDNHSTLEQECPFLVDDSVVVECYLPMVDVECPSFDVSLGDEILCVNAQESTQESSACKAPDVTDDVIQVIHIDFIIGDRLDLPQVIFTFLLCSTLYLGYVDPKVLKSAESFDSVERIRHMSKEPLESSPSLLKKFRTTLFLHCCSFLKFCLDFIGTIDSAFV